MQEVHDYGIKFWSNNEFKIEKGLVKVCHGKNPSLLEIVQSVRDKGYRGPLLVRFPIWCKNKSKACLMRFFQRLKSINTAGLLRRFSL